MKVVALKDIVRLLIVWLTHVKPEYIEYLIMKSTSWNCALKDLIGLPTVTG